MCIMPRIAYGRNKTQVDLSVYPDNTNYPIGTGEWNQDPEDGGMLGFTKQSATLSNNTFSPTATLVEITGQTTTDDIDSIGTTNTNESDLLYLLSANSQTLTLKHQNGGVGEIILLGNTDKILSTTIPTLLIRDDTSGSAKWYEWGGGSANLSTLTVDADKSWGFYKISDVFFQPVSLANNDTVSITDEVYAIGKYSVIGNASLSVTGNGEVNLI